MALCFQVVPTPVADNRLQPLKSKFVAKNYSNNSFSFPTSDTLRCGQPMKAIHDGTMEVKWMKERMKRDREEELQKNQREGAN